MASSISSVNDYRVQDLTQEHDDMSNELFEVAFSGQVSNISEIEQVKVRVGEFLNANATKVDQLFSGKRVVIKKYVDLSTAQNYQIELTKIGAIAEVKSMSTVASMPIVAATTLATTQLLPPQINPLGIMGDQILDLDVTLAPIGSAMQDSLLAFVINDYDLSGLDVAPVGSQIDTSKQALNVPFPDISGLSLVD